MNYIWDVTNTKTYNNSMGRYKFQKEFEFIKKHIADNTVNVLDIAGGSGRFAIPLINYCSDITVIDINEEAIAILQKRSDKIKAIWEDFNHFLVEQQYKIILCIEGFGYFENKNLFFEKINALLAENGTFIFTSLNPRSWRFYLRNIIHSLKGTSTKYYDLNIQKLAILLNKHNLRIEGIEGMHWIPLPLSSNCKMVSAFAYIEHKLRLHKYLKQSPMWLIAVKKY
ncbi:MAG: class I SAM-dependent methyltransferase [Pigmentiphaga sp.]|nr:class I SAM-dependent methyltransferase [Pigmentiphaga sp.]